MKTREKLTAVSHTSFSREQTMKFYRLTCYPERFTSILKSLQIRASISINDRQVEESWLAHGLFGGFLLIDLVVLFIGFSFVTLSSEGIMCQLTAGFYTLLKVIHEGCANIHFPKPTYLLPRQLHFFMAGRNYVVTTGKPSTITFQPITIISLTS